MDHQSLTLEVSRRICSHMNNDHRDTLKIYASKYAGIINPSHIEMIEINQLAMQLKVDDKVITISFDHALIDSKDAHKTLVSMAS